MFLLHSLFFLLLFRPDLTRGYNVCKYGESTSKVARTCSEILAKNQYCIYDSAVRYIDCGDGDGAETHEVYCDMSHMAGGWQRVANLNFTASDPCPVGSTWMPVNVNGIDYCSTIDGYTVASWVLYPKCSFSEVSGYIIADQRGKMEGFSSNLAQSHTLEDTYVDGISITVGNTSSVRRHIFTYAVGREELPRIESCPCHGAPLSIVPHFVGFDYHCDSTYAPYTTNSNDIGYRTLWSGEGCDDGSICCNSADTPWFYHQLHNNVRDEPLEIRILSDAASHNEEMILVREIALFVR